MFDAPSLGNCGCHGNRIMAVGGHAGNVMGCDHPNFIQIGSLIGELYHFQHFALWRPSAILNLIFLLF